MNYKEFLNDKDFIIKSCGFEVDRNSLNHNLYDFQKDIVRFCLMKGRSAIFADCGLGKTLMQLEWANKVCNYTGGNVLILAPLAVASQTMREGKLFGIPVNICATQSDVFAGINITNYEKLDNFISSEFVGVVLDESSILKSFTSKTRDALIDNFINVPYKLACTATPAPNDYMELGNHSEFLGVMTRCEMLAMYFVHDGGSTSKWRLKGHAEEIFWQWMASWSVFINNPKNLDYHVDGYDLPKLNIHEIIVDGFEPTNEVLSLTERREARKESLYERCRHAADIINNQNDNFLVWCDLNDESKMLSEMIDESIEVKGSDKPEHKTNSIIGFSENKIKVLVTKPSIAGFGINWQNCNNMIFVGLSDSYEKYYQAVRRCWRFGQTQEVNVYIIIGKKEGCVKENIARKQADYDKMQENMTGLTMEITKKELSQTCRLSTPYKNNIKMVLPLWEEMK